MHPTIVAEEVEGKENDEKRLLRYLMKGYERDVRPVRNASTPIVIQLSITLTQIFDMDEKNQVLTTIIWLDQVSDARLQPTLPNHPITKPIPSRLTIFAPISLHGLSIVHVYDFHLLSIYLLHYSSKECAFCM